MTILPTTKLVYFCEIGYLRKASWVCIDVDQEEDGRFFLRYIFEEGSYAVPEDGFAVAFDEGDTITQTFFDNLLKYFIEWDDCENRQEALDYILNQFKKYKIEIK